MTIATKTTFATCTMLDGEAPRDNKFFVTDIDSSDTEAVSQFLESLNDAKTPEELEELNVLFLDLNTGRFCSRANIAEKQDISERFRRDMSDSFVHDSLASISLESRLLLRLDSKWSKIRQSVNQHLQHGVRLI